MTDYPRGRDVSDALTEVRTVLSRAESALERLDRLDRWGRRDRDHLRMCVALRGVIDNLDEWRRTGRPRKKEQ